LQKKKKRKKGNPRCYRGVIGREELSQGVEVLLERTGDFKGGI